MSRIELSACLKTFLAHIYPDMDLDTISFHEGLPFYARRSPAAITIGRRIYFRPGKFDACSADGVALVAHELFHIKQGAGGPGYWFLRPFYMRYAWHTITSGFKSGRSHPLEKPAYALQAHVRTVCRGLAASTSRETPCVCANGRPTAVDQAFVDAFFLAFESL